MAKKYNQSSEDLTKTESFFDKNRNIIIYGGAGIILLLLIIIGYQKLVSEPKEIESQEVLWSALNDFAKDSLELAATGKNGEMGLEEIASEYKGTSGGNIANYCMAIISMERGEFDTALDYLDDCSFKDVMVGTLKIGLEGDCHVELGNYEKAAKLFEKAADREKNEFTSPMFLKKAALTYEELGDIEKANQLYQVIKDEYPQTSEGKEIEKYLAKTVK